MTPDDKALLSILLDDEASPDEVARALALIERKPDLMAYVERHQWLRAHWQKEYAGPQIDLRAGIWDKIAADNTASETGLVDELALRREARGLAQAMNYSNDVATDATQDHVTHTTVIEVDGPLAPKAPAGESATQQVQQEDDAAVSVSAMPNPQKRWWQPVAQLAVAASVCFAVVGVWYFDQPGTAAAPPASLVADSGVQAVPFNDAVARSQTAVASQLAASNNRASVASTSPTTLPVSNLVLPGAVQGVSSVAFEQSLPEHNNFVSLESLAAQERARLQSYYMMHTSNSALMQPVQGMQLVRIVDTPPSPQVRSTEGR